MEPGAEAQPGGRRRGLRPVLSDPRGDFSLGTEACSVFAAAAHWNGQVVASEGHLTPGR